MKNQNGKMENNGKVTELKDENRDEDKDTRNYEIAIRAFATQLRLYDLGIGNYAMVNESNFIGEFDDL